MAGTIILSDDFWLLSPTFGAASSDHAGPTDGEITSVFPLVALASNISPEISVIETVPGSEAPPPASEAVELRPGSYAANIRPGKPRVV